MKGKFQVVDVGEGKSYFQCKPILSSDSFVKWLMENKEAHPEYATWFVTGDYDIHDMISRMSHVHPIPSDSSEEAVILTRLSDEIIGRERKHLPREFEAEEFSPIQHGPQYNYPAHMLDSERGTPMSPIVTDIDYSIALFDGIRWEIIATPELDSKSGMSEEERKKKRRAEQAQKLEAYYKSHAAKLKVTWRDTDEALSKQQELLDLSQRLN